MRPGTLVPVLPEATDRVLRAIEVSQSGCWLSVLTPSHKRPYVWIPDGAKGRAVVAYRVVMATELDRPILPEEDVHHRCETKRCVNPAHLEVELHVDHQSHHAEEARQDSCSVHGTPYERVNAKGWGVCRACGRDATVRYRAAHPTKPITQEQRDRKNEAARIRLKSPEGRAKNAAKKRAYRARKKLTAL